MIGNNVEPKRYMKAYNHTTTEKTELYVSPDVQSATILTLEPNIQVRTSNETKYFFKVEAIEGISSDTQVGYVRKKHLQKIK
ncbi:hypothetical protein AGMMS4956_18740 [Bacteroidia bacterium]|nr:hypothetical protein AGMMS4956_18740 [Bacteroidia bacterium]